MVPSSFLLKWEGTFATNTSNIPEIKTKPLFKECELEVVLLMLTAKIKTHVLHHTDK